MGDSQGGRAVSDAGLGETALEGSFGEQRIAHPKALLGRHD